MIDYDDECGAVDGMRIGRGKRSTWRKPEPVTICPQQLPHDLTWDRTRLSAVETVTSSILLFEKIIAHMINKFCGKLCSMELFHEPRHLEINLKFLRS
jgi:hypothetical protein